MRIGIVALLHESNTFVQSPTNLDNFRDDLFLRGESIREQLAGSHHEIGGFFAGIAEDDAFSAVPLVAFRAMPSGTISGEALASLLQEITARVGATHPLDGMLVAPHGAAVCETQPDADGFWLSELRHLLGSDVPIIGTLDAHANLSARMVNSSDALIAYRSNPHLDQRDRGREAARLMMTTLRGDARPTMAAAFPPLAINIDRQCTTEPHLQPIYQYAHRQLRDDDRVLSNSIVLGFPYANVAEMGASTIAVTNDDPGLAQEVAVDLAQEIWARRDDLRGRLVSVREAIEQCLNQPNQRICLLDMGDNVGGGSAADGTTLLAELLRCHVPAAFLCLYDPQSAAACSHAGVGQELHLRVGGKSDQQHGPPVELDAKVVSLHDGHFREDRPRHGGIVEFDQGETAIVRVATKNLTLMLTSRRMVPFSLAQLSSCRLDPRQFHVLVAKGVNAPIAAYEEVCDTFIRVNTIGSTCADLSQLDLSSRRRPMYPFEPTTRWSARGLR